MELYLRQEGPEGLSPEQIEKQLELSVTDISARKVLIIPPDFTRFYSGAGTITNRYYHRLTERGAQVDILPALGTHAPMTAEERHSMFGDIPPERFFVHNWRRDVVKLGQVPAQFMAQATDGAWNAPIDVEINRRVTQGEYDLIISVGQVVPHEVVGMSNHAKNLFVGVGGCDMINKSHMVGAVYGMERMMGRDDTPVRRMFDYAFENYLNKIPIMFVLTVATEKQGQTHIHGLFLGRGRECFSQAAALSREKNLSLLPRPIRKCVVYLPEKEFKSTWLGNKAIYRTRMAMADAGELVILAPGVERFGEDETVDELIRKYGYLGREKVQKALEEDPRLRENMSAAAHLIHGCAEGRFRVTYAPGGLTREQMLKVGFEYAPLAELEKRYDPKKLEYGYNTLPDGERIFFIPNPALGLWACRERFENN